MYVSLFQTQKGVWGAGAKEDELSSDEAPAPFFTALGGETGTQK